MTTAARLTRLSVVLPALLLVLLAGCSAGWKAPMEHRGDASRYGHQGAARDLPIRAKTYRVQRGDTLYSIAWRADQDFRGLARLNGIRPPYTIYPGQVLRLTASASTSRPAPKPRTQTSRSTPPKTQAERKPTAARREAPASTASERSDGSLRWQWPADGAVLARYSANDATRQGVKIGGKAGQSILAAEAGRVVYSGSGLIGYGQLIIIKHNDNYLSAYGHNAKLLVKEGDQVARGRHIADMGRSNDGQPMLHFEIRREGRPVDPLALLPRR